MAGQEKAGALPWETSVTTTSAITAELPMINPGDISAIAASLSGAVGLGKAMIGVRDFNQIAAQLADLNGQLLDAQQALFKVFGDAMAVQAQLAEAEKENLELKATLEERGKYSLVEITPDNFAYGLKVDSSREGEPAGAEPFHYVCQPCFNKRVKSVLGRKWSSWSYVWNCSICDRDIPIP